MFQFSGFAHLSVYYVFNIVGCPIRVSTDQFVCANPRSFSQLITSFFASESLGIPHTPFVTFSYIVLHYQPLLLRLKTHEAQLAPLRSHYHLNSNMHRLLSLLNLSKNVLVELHTVA